LISKGKKKKFDCSIKKYKKREKEREEKENQNINCKIFFLKKKIISLLIEIKSIILQR